MGEAQLGPQWAEATQTGARRPRHVARLQRGSQTNSLGCAQPHGGSPAAATLGNGRRVPKIMHRACAARRPRPHGACTKLRTMRLPTRQKPLRAVTQNVSAYSAYESRCACVLGVGLPLRCRVAPLCVLVPSQFIVLMGGAGEVGCLLATQAPNASQPHDGSGADACAAAVPKMRACVLSVRDRHTKCL